jgi:hypothetical protein
MRETRQARRGRRGTFPARLAGMALREFRDDAGREWRAWDITAEQLHPSTRAENHMQGVLEGWLVFESTDGEAKARLYPIPPSWRTASHDDLRELLYRAEPTRESGEYRRFASADRTGARTVGRVAESDVAVSRDERSSSECRSFRYPGGRYWSVAEYVVHHHVGEAERTPHRVLRFTAGARTLDTSSWPAGWRGFSDHQLADLLWRSFPRRVKHDGPTVNFRRRRGDLAVET